jgi:hypothetical protein
MVDLLERHVHLALGAETGERRFATGAYGFWRAHVHALLLEARGEAADSGSLDAMTDALLAPLAPELYQYQRRRRGRTPAEISRALADLARAACNPSRARATRQGREVP